MLIVIVDYEHGFVGSRSYSRAEALLKFNGEEAILNYLHREFPSTSFDDILFIKDDKVVAEWFGGRAEGRVDVL